VISIQPTSIQRNHDEFWSNDPAIVQPPEDPPADADDKVKEAHKATVTEWLRQIDTARETGQWDPILVAGMHPTKFTLRPIPGQALRAIHAKMERGELDTWRQAAPIAFRACIVKIENPSITFKPEKSDEYGMLAPVAITDRLDAVDMGIVTELGMLCLSRGTQGLSPK
jgi:hypothetical protein